MIRAALRDELLHARSSLDRVRTALLTERRGENRERLKRREMSLAVRVVALDRAYRETSSFEASGSRLAGGTL